MKKLLFTLFITLCTINPYYKIRASERSEGKALTYGWKPTHSTKHILSYWCRKAKIDSLLIDLVAIIKQYAIRPGLKLQLYAVKEKNKEYNILNRHVQDSIVYEIYTRPMSKFNDENLFSLDDCSSVCMQKTNYKTGEITDYTLSPGLQLIVKDYDLRLVKAKGDHTFYALYNNPSKFFILKKEENNVIDISKCLLLSNFLHTCHNPYLKYKKCSYVLYDGCLLYVQNIDKNAVFNQKEGLIYYFNETTFGDKPFINYLNIKNTKDQGVLVQLDNDDTFIPDTFEISKNNKYLYAQYEGDCNGIKGYELFDNGKKAKLVFDSKNLRLREEIQWVSFGGEDGSLITFQVYDNQDTVYLYDRIIDKLQTFDIRKKKSSVETLFFVGSLCVLGLANEYLVLS